MKNMSLKKAIADAFALKKERKWDKIYFAVDLHGTIIVPGRNIAFQPYPKAAACLKYLSSRKDIVLILYTGTHESMLVDFKVWCTCSGIVFPYINSNPECGNTHDGDFARKMYFNLLLDDRAGFDPETDWDIVLKEVKKYA